MGEILGLGLTHYPPLIGLDENMAGILRTVLKDPGLPERHSVNTRSITLVASARQYSVLMPYLASKPFSIWPITCGTMVP